MITFLWTRTSKASNPFASHHWIPCSKVWGEIMSKVSLQFFEREQQVIHNMSYWWGTKASSVHAWPVHAWPFKMSALCVDIFSFSCNKARTLSTISRWFAGDGFVRYIKDWRTTIWRSNSFSHAMPPTTEQGRRSILLVIIRLSFTPSFPKDRKTPSFQRRRPPSQDGFLKCMARQRQSQI